MLCINTTWIKNVVLQYAHVKVANEKRNKKCWKRMEIAVKGIIELRHAGIVQTLFLQEVIY